MGDFTKFLPDDDTFRTLDVKQLKHLQNLLHKEKYKREIRLKEIDTLIEKVRSRILSHPDGVGTPLGEYDNS